LAEGQTFAIGGLLDNRETEVLEKVPFIGDVPILGKFFQSKQRTKSNTELMVIVTPTLVRPVPAGQSISGLKYPVPFLTPNTGTDMATPGSGPAAAAPGTAALSAVPVETLLKSMEQRPMVVNSTSGAFGAGAAASPSSQAAAPAPPSSPAR
jgi:pilus assembly protein CpaC